ncbi:hypothetical protein [Azospirillum sp. ST 5-10]|uniref:hypothetical protein n=1 Tax=unclassified Azospirillum TaxID=2630922 RepID=UPI003F49EA9E
MAAQKTIEKMKLSGSTNGRPIKVVATATAGTTIHTAVNSAGQLDEIWLWASNTDGTDRKLTIEFGGTSSPDDLIEVTITAESGLVPVIPGLPLDGGVVVRAFASQASVINVVGYVLRAVS